ncbi:MAG TPA: DUF4157 domain-containing protein [Longimicrobium sp.]|jgi:hypothetical protein
MRTFAQKQDRPPKQASPRAVHPGQAASGPTAAAYPFHYGRIPLYLTAPVQPQAKLTVNTPGDPYEKEADRVAGQVMRMPEPRVQRACACGGGTEEECEECRARGTVVQRRVAEEGAPHAEGTRPAAAPAIVDEAARAPGRPLDPATRAFMETRFGRDFGGVRIHVGGQAAAAARAIRARAYTLGSDIVFGRDAYAPDTPGGRHLLAHELAHTVQQSRGGPGGGAAGGLVQRAITFDDCTADQQEVIKKAHKRAQEMLSQVIEKLKKYDGTNPPEIKTSLDSNMKDSSVTLAAGLAKRLARLATAGDDTQYECNMEGTSRAWSLWCVPFSDIELHPAWFSDPELDAKARTMIHEWLHRYQCAFDLAYKSDPEYAKLSKGQAKTNADSIARFVYEAR